MAGRRNETRLASAAVRGPRPGHGPQDLGARVSLQDRLRHLPSVDGVLAEPALAGALARHGRALVLAEVRRTIEARREQIRTDPTREAGDGPAELARLVTEALDRRARGSLADVLNATGVLVHTNLGRASLGKAVIERLSARAAGATSLEMDLATGERGRRAAGCEDLLAELTGAEAACVVNNCAAALVLALNTFAVGRAVVVSRGEAVEIGGSFRIPAICERAGARLVEVGTTNRTRLSDYEAALDAHDVGLILKVHPSNFRVVGFTEDTALRELADLGRARNVPVFMDQGSGALADLSPLGVTGEPSVPWCVEQGADLVAFSGDKLLGGPQAGCLVGRSAAVQSCRRNPLYRALRVGRLVAAALEATLWAHASGRSQDIPVLAQLSLPATAIEERARAVVAASREAASRAGVTMEVARGESTSGGGSSPGSRIETFVIRLAGGRVGVTQLAARLRTGEPAVLGRVAGDALLLDLRTVPPERDGDVTGALQAVLSA